MHFFFFFNDTATTEIYPLSLHDALPIYWAACLRSRRGPRWQGRRLRGSARDKRARCGTSRIPPTFSARVRRAAGDRSEEHTSELQSQSNLVCRLLLEKKKINHVSSHDVT